MPYTHGYKMAAYAEYKWEHKEFSDVYNLLIPQSDAVKVCNKLLRHFHAGSCSVRFTGRTGGGRTWSQSGEILLHNNPLVNMGVVVHEAAHILNFRLYNERGHGKKFKKAVKRCMAYVRKKNYWDSELLVQFANEVYPSESSRLFSVWIDFALMNNYN